MPRAGYPAHHSLDDPFWKSLTNGKVALPSYNKEKFCEGFDLTVLDFYIVRRRLVTLLYRNNLYLRKQKEGNKVFLEVGFEYAVVQDRISKHVLLTSPYVHPWWRNKMIAEFVTRTAECMRTLQEPIDVKINGGSNPQPAIWPHHRSITSLWTWGDEVKKIKYDNMSYIQASHFEIVVDTVLLVQKHLENIPFPEIVDGGDPRKALSLEDAEFNLLYSITWDRYELRDTDGLVFAYRNPIWGGEFLQIDDDASLRVALKALHVKGKNSVVTFVSRCLDLDLA